MRRRSPSVVGAPLHAFRLKGAEHLRDGQRFVASGGVEVVAEYTPGHSSDHVAFFVPSEGALFTGDAVVGRGTSFIDPPDGDLVQYLRSLHRMQELDPRRHLPGARARSCWTRAPSWTSTSRTAKTASGRCSELLGEEPRTIADLVATIYADYPPDVHALAERSVLAHLLKLESEGRAERKGKSDGATWTISEPRACARCGRPVKGRARLCGPCSLAVLQDTGGRGG